MRLSLSPALLAFVVFLVLLAVVGYFAGAFSRASDSSEGSALPTPGPIAESNTSSPGIDAGEPGPERSANRREQAGGETARRLQVRVLDPEGRPVPAKLWYAEKALLPQLDLAQYYGVAGTPSLFARIQLSGAARTCDEEGGAELPIRTKLWIVATHGRDVGALRLEAPTSEAFRQERVDLRLQRPAELCVTVVGPNGGPVPGVVLTLQVVRDRVPLALRASRRLGVTDERGQLVVPRTASLQFFDGAREGEYERVTVRAPGIDVHGRVHWATRARSSLRLQLPLYGSVEVRGLPPTTRNENGMSREVRVLVPSEGGLVALLSEEGSATFPVVALGKELYVASAWGQHSVTGPKLPGEHVVWDLREQELGSIVLCLKDTSGAPVDASHFGVQLGQVDKGNFYSTRWVVDENRLRIEQVPLADTYPIYVRARSGPYRGHRSQVQARGPRRPGESRETVVEFEAPIRLTGRLLGPAGEPLRNATVGLSLRTSSEIRAVVVGLDDEGRFVLPISASGRGAEVHELSVQLREETVDPRGPLRVELDGVLTRVQDRDFGDRRLRRVAPLLVGRILLDGKPLSMEDFSVRPRLLVEHRSRPDEDWSRLAMYGRGAIGVVASGGRSQESELRVSGWGRSHDKFAIFGEVPPGELRLRTRIRGAFRAPEPIPFDAGRRGLVIQLWRTE